MTWTRLDRAALRAWPLPQVAKDGDKEDRGSVLVVAGSREVPGAAALAGIAALRAGAGKLVVATACSAAPGLAAMLPEARVIALAETGGGGFDLSGLQQLRGVAESAAAVLIGPGCMDEEATVRFTAALLPWVTHAQVVLDALAMNVLADSGRLAQPVLISPHAGEMAHLTGKAKESISADPQGEAASASDRWNVVVALKGAATAIASPDGGRWLHDEAHPGLATSGSGDVLAGIVTGLAARGAPLEQACAWGVVLHSMAGQRLGDAVAPMGYLARELSGQIPALMHRLGPGRLRRVSRPAESRGG